MFALPTVSGVELEMNEMAEESSRCAERRPPPAESPRRYRWTMGRQDSRHRREELPSSPPSRVYEELFCTGRAADVLTSSGPHGDVVRRGYLGKMDRDRRRYFSLRVGSHTGPSRLEWYKNQEKFSAVERSAGKASLFGSNKRGVIYLRCCLGVSRSGSSKKSHTVALYAKDQTQLVLVAEDQWEQEDWYLAIKKLMEEERKDEEHGKVFDEEDDGYCTLPSAAFFKEVWPVTVKPIGLGCSRSLAGDSRLCLTATALILVRVSACSNLLSVTIPLLSVRRFGHLDGCFYLELGRSAPTGPGEIWMEARDQGSPAVAQHVHEAVRETVGALRALPDFSGSPTSSHNRRQTLLALKRCRPKYRDRLARPPGSRLAPPLEPQSPRSSAEMKADPHLPVSRGVAVATGEDQAPGYMMMMSPPASRSSPVLPQDDYVTMASPEKHQTYSSPSSSLQTSFNSSASDSYSPLHPSHLQTDEPRQPFWLVTSVQRSETDASQSREDASPPPARSVGRTGTSGPDYASGRSRRAASDKPVRRHRLSLCLPSCLQAEDRD